MSSLMSPLIGKSMHFLIQKDLRDFKLKPEQRAFFEYTKTSEFGLLPKAPSL